LLQQHPLIAAKRTFTGEQFKQDHTQRIDVAATIGRFAIGGLRTGQLALQGYALNEVVFYSGFTVLENGDVLCAHWAGHQIRRADLDGFRLMFDRYWRLC